MRGVSCWLAVLAFGAVYMLVSRRAGDLEAILTALAAVVLFAGTGYVADRVTRRILRR